MIFYLKRFYYQIRNFLKIRISYIKRIYQQTKLTGSKSPVRLTIWFLLNKEKYSEIEVPESQKDLEKTALLIGNYKAVLKSYKSTQSNLIVVRELYRLILSIRKIED